MEQSGNMGRIVGGLSRHVAHVVEIAAGPEFAFNVVMELHPCRLGIRCQGKDGGRQRSIVGNGHRVRQDRRNLPGEAVKRGPGFRRVGKQPGTLGRFRPGDQKAGQKSRTPRQTTGMVEEATQGGFLYL